MVKEFLLTTLFLAGTIAAVLSLCHVVIP